MEIRTRKFGTTGLEITVVGLGAWAMGGPDWRYGWGPQDDEESIRTIEHAIDLGINWIDTAATYGLGHSEEVVGRALKRIPSSKRPYIFTKCGMRAWSDDRFKEPIRILEPSSIRRECEASLRRLGVDYIDLYQFHWPDDFGTPVEESWAEMVKLKAEGKIRHIGVCNFNIELLERCERIAHVETLQPPFSMIRRGFAAETLAWCREHNTGVIVYSPMQSGLLSGKFSKERAAALPSTDWRTRDERFQEPQLSRNLALADGLKPIAERKNTNVASLAVAWTLSWPGVTAAIVGARRPDQVDEWIRAGDVQLDPSDLDQIAELIRQTGAGEGPERP